MPYPSSISNTWVPPGSSLGMDHPSPVDAEAFLGGRLGNPLDLFAYLLQPRQERISVQSGPYAYYGPSRYSTVPPENIAAVKQLMEMMAFQDETKSKQEKEKMGRDVLLTRGSPGNKMTFKGVTKQVTPPRGFSESDIGLAYGGGYVPTVSRGIPGGAPGGQDLYPSTNKGGQPQIAKDIAAKRKEISYINKEIDSTMSNISKAINSYRFTVEHPEDLSKDIDAYLSGEKPIPANAPPSFRNDINNLRMLRESLSAAGAEYDRLQNDPEYRRWMQSPESGGPAGQVWGQDANGNPIRLN